MYVYNSTRNCLSVCNGFGLANNLAHSLSLPLTSLPVVAFNTSVCPFTNAIALRFKIYASGGHFKTHSAITAGLSILSHNICPPADSKNCIPEVEGVLILTPPVFQTKFFKRSSTPIYAKVRFF